MYRMLERQRRGGRTANNRQQSVRPSFKGGEFIAASAVKMCQPDGAITTTDSRLALLPLSLSLSLSLCSPNALLLRRQKCIYRFP